ncbi:hypothetical protein BSL78_16160 [Apostichopus japonicus]|uniref:Uncharacterized protein n=1 Tax=Stichopus japonicus TaxID=307972 RepID=A0A2G8KG46_STIJA|nr:hypothetical protein BSL78_16160 [Apostichopus japonicus]
MGHEKLRCVQYFGIYFIITGLAIICIGAAETKQLITNFTYSGLTFISCGAFMLLAHSSMRGLRHRERFLDERRQRQSSVYYNGQDITISLEVNVETVRDYLSVSKRTGNAVIINIHEDGHLTCELSPDDDVDPALLTACAIPDMEVETLDLNVTQLRILGKILRLVRRISTERQYQNGKVCTFEDGTISLYIWHGFDSTNNVREVDAPPVYDDAVRIPVIQEEEPPSYNDVTINMGSVL